MTTINDVEFLAKVTLFSLVRKSELERIAKLASRLRFHAGEVIIREGDPDKRLFIIVSGEVEVIKGLGGKNERHVANLALSAILGRWP